MEIQTIIIIGAIIQLITLICFFVLCANVSKISKSISGKNTFDSMFKMYLSLGETEKAKKLLLNEMKNDDCLQQCFCETDGLKAGARAKLTGEYAKYIKVLGMDFNFGEVDKIK